VCGVTRTKSAEPAKTTLRGSVLDVVRDLLADGRRDELLEVVGKLVARNEELEVLLGKVRERNRRERVSGDQLDLFLTQLLAAMGGELAEADAKLKDTAEQNGGREKDHSGASETKPENQPPARRPPPPGLRRVVNPIAVPPEERACPVCGSERACIGHDTTSVIELIPAEVIVRLDQRELLACRNCEAEVVRAPRGDKVVDGGIYGSRLVASLVVGKYWDSLPLHRQGQQLERLGLSMPSSSMADQIRWATELLEPVWLFLMTQVLFSTVMHLDATSLPVKDKDAIGGITLGSLWGYVGDESAAVYLYTRTGKKVGQVEGEIGPHDFLSKRTGFVVADAAGLFDEDFRRPDLIEIGCNMHYLERRIIRRIHEGRRECSGGVLRCGSAPPDNAVRSKRVLVRSTCSCRRRSTGIGSSRSGARVGAAAARWSSTCRRRAGSWSTAGAGDEILSRTSRETGSVALRVSILDVVARVAIRRGPRASQLVRCPAR
jgi:transposase